MSTGNHSNLLKILKSYSLTEAQEYIKNLVSATFSTE